MTTAFKQLIAEHYPKPAAARKPQKLLRRDKRSQSIRLAMRRLRKRRHAANLNSSGKPLGSNTKFRNRKYQNKP